MPGIGTITASTLAALFGGGAIYLRRRVSRNWLDYTNSGPQDLSSRGVIVVTGASTGLGYETAKEFAKRRATVVLACRDVQKAEEAADRIAKSIDATADPLLSARERLVVSPLDLASLDSVETFADELAAKYSRRGVYALVCNAGVWMPMDQHAKTEDGYEMHFGVNHLGHLALIRAVADRMMTKSKKEDCRVVLVSSGLAKNGKIDMEKQDFVYEGRTQQNGGEDSNSPDNNDDSQSKKKKSHASFAPTGYCDSKLMNALTNRRLAAKFGKTAPHVTTYACCPGFCRTSLGRHVQFPFYKKLLLGPLMLMIQRNSVQGAQNIIHATLEDRDKLESGGMYRDGQIAKSKETKYMDSLDKDLPLKLWNLSEQMLKGMEK
mmetsp:Transcript_14957/g.35693  ORF Transcript_14957/g.35693 Transcript_14957/m.35693 type:complete len:378 (-) Transcript_14957:8-1141(-)